jgi:hypothetical protein
MSHDDFEFEPVRGLPAMLPAGERLLWQGSPNWKSLAVRAYHVRKVALYFAALVLWRTAVGISNAHSPAAIALSCAFLLALGGIAIGVLSLLAYLTGRATVYSITSRRVLLRHGVAVPMTMNIPFKVIESAELRMFSDHTGEIALKMLQDQRVGYLITWPHLRPGFITRPQPSLRAIGDAQRAAEILGSALAADAGVPATGTPAAGVPAAGAPGPGLPAGLRHRTALTA